MYSFILGFQRRVWWPKCTPASRKSFIVIFDKLPPLVRCQVLGIRCQVKLRDCLAISSVLFDLTPGTSHLKPDSLPLRELEALARALLPVFLALFRTGIARKKTALPQCRAQLRIKNYKRACNAQPRSTRLPVDASATGIHDDIKFPHIFSGHQRLSDFHPHRL